MADTPPDSLLCNGETNPVDVENVPVPYFSAIYRSEYAYVSAEQYQIQVDTDPAFGDPVWDSDWQDLDTSCPKNNRCENIDYGGGLLPEVGTKYYWRIRFRFWGD